MRSICLYVLLCLGPVSAFAAAGVCGRTILSTEPTADQAEVAQAFGRSGLDENHRLIFEGTFGILGPGVAEYPLRVDHPLQVIRRDYRGWREGFIASPALLVEPVSQGLAELNFRLEPRGLFSLDEEAFNDLRFKMLRGDLRAFQRAVGRVSFALSCAPNADIRAFVNRSKLGHHVRLSEAAQIDFLERFGAFEALARVRDEFGDASIKLLPFRVQFNPLANAVRLFGVPMLEIPRAHGRMAVLLAFYRHLHRALGERWPDLLGLPGPYPQPVERLLKDAVSPDLRTAALQAQRDFESINPDTMMLARGRVEEKFELICPFGRFEVEGFTIPLCRGDGACAR